MPGASGWPAVAIGVLGRLRQRAAEHALDLARAAGRRDAAASAPRSIRRWWIRRRPRPAPPSTIRSIRPARSLCTCAAVVGETWPDRFADGATTGPPKARRMSRATGWAGTRIATVSSPAVARSATAQSLGFGQHQRQRPRPERLGQRGRRSHRNARSAGRRARSPTWAISGLKDGPALGLIEPRDRGRVGGVGAEAIDGLGREPDQPAFAPGNARPRPRRPRRRAKSAFSGPHSQESDILNSASCGVRNPRL